MFRTVTLFALSAALLVAVGAPATAARHHDVSASDDRAQARAEAAQARKAREEHDADAARARRESQQAKEDARAQRQAEATARRDGLEAKREHDRAREDGAAARDEGAIARNESAAAGTGERQHHESTGKAAGNTTAPTAPTATPSPTAEELVLGYDRADGHHVDSYKRTRPDGTKADNLDARRH